jgi:hypothetical protein
MVSKLVRNVACRAHFINFTIILAMAVVFLLPALDNGFPFVFSDTGQYLGVFGIRHLQGRPAYYAIFTRLLDLGLSPWPSVVVQSLITSWVIWLFASVLFAINGAIRLLSLGVLLLLGTSLPWFVGWMMPDIFTPLMIIALALLCFARDSLPRPSEIILVLLIGAALAIHQANLPVALWMIPAFGLCALLGWRPRKGFLHGLFASGIGLTLGVVALVAMHLVSGTFGLSSSGSVFLLARTLGDGTALSCLEQVCPQQRFAVCAQLDELKSLNSLHPGELADYFLWAGPLRELGGFRAEEAEAKAIVVGTLLNYPLAQFRAAVGNGWRQFFCFRTGTELTTYSETDDLSVAIRAAFGAVIYDNYRQSKQIRNIFEFDWINRIHIPIKLKQAVHPQRESDGRGCHRPAGCRP